MHDAELSASDRETVLEFGLAIKDLPTQGAWERLIEALDRHGFRRCFYGFIPDVAQATADRPLAGQMTVLTSYDDAFLQMYRDFGEHIHAASVDYAKHNVVPTLLAPIITATLESPAMPAACRERMLDYNQRTHIYDGVLVPLRGPVFSATGGASVLVDPAETPEAAHAHARRYLPLAAELIAAFHNNIQYSSLLPRERRLTPREQEILRWLAQGLMTKQIAEKTGTSASTVEKQLASARLRLAAGNNTNLLLKAMAYDLL